MDLASSKPWLVAYDAADKRRYEAKRLGRDRTE